CRFLSIELPCVSILFPYTTLFRSMIVGRIRALMVLVFASAKITRPLCLKVCLQKQDCLSRAAGLGAGPQRRVGSVTSGSAAREKDRKSTRLNSSHVKISYAVFCLK